MKSVVVNNPIARLITEGRNGRYKAFSTELSPEKINEAVRAKFAELLPQKPGGGYDARSLRKNIHLVYDIIEEVLNVTVNDAWRTGEFWDTVVDYRNVALGDKADFVVEDGSWLAVNTFAGNTWDTDRYKLPAGRKISVETYWFYVRTYEELERFLIGSTTVEYMVNKLTEAFVRLGDSLIGNAFNDAGNNLPADFNFTGGLNEIQMRQLISRVRIASGKNVRIIGTEMAISQLNSLAEVKYSENMMNEVYTTGRLGRWQGISLVEIPQTFKKTSYEFAVDDDKLIIAPEGEKFIKFVDEGDIRTQLLDETQTHDQTIDYQMQRKLGCAVVFGSMFGKYQIV